MRSSPARRATTVRFDAAGRFAGRRRRPSGPGRIGHHRGGAGGAVGASVDCQTVDLLFLGLLTGARTPVDEPDPAGGPTVADRTAQLASQLPAPIVADVQVLAQAVGADPDPGAAVLGRADVRRAEADLAGRLHHTCL